MKITFKKRFIILSLIVVLMIVAWYMRHRVIAMQSDVPTVTVSAVTVKESSIPLDIQAVGTLTAQSVDISPELSGHVNAVLAQDGSEVKKGAPILQLDDAIYRTKLTSAKAQLVYSENNYKRMVLLGKQGAIAQQAIDQADADLKQKRAEELECEVMVKKMQLLAPFDGVIGKVKVNPGDYVTVGQNIVTITDTKHLRIEYAVPENYLSQLKVGQQVTITSSTYNGKEFTGQVAYISPVINPANRSLQLYANISNDAGLLASGMFVTVRQSLGVQEHALMVPARSAVSVMDGQQVYKIVDAKAVPIDVKLGMRMQDNVQIIEGLSVGDVIVTDGQLKLRSGSSVKIQS